VNTFLIVIYWGFQKLFSIEKIYSAAGWFSIIPFSILNYFFH